MRDLQYMIDVMTAARDGKRVEMRSWDQGTKFQPMPNFAGWNWNEWDYRIAPEPRKARECWAIFAEDGPLVRMFGGKSEAYAFAECRVQASDRVVHMREVLPECEKTATEIAGGATRTRIEELRRLLAEAQNLLRAP